MRDFAVARILASSAFDPVQHRVAGTYGAETPTPGRLPQGLDQVGRVRSRRANFFV
jgi:hypothetical protein